MSAPREITPEYVAELAARNAQLEAHLKVSKMLRADLERMLANERHARWGAKSEKLSPDRRYLPFEDIDVVEGMLEAAGKAGAKATRKAPHPRNRASPPWTPCPRACRRSKP